MENSRIFILQVLNVLKEYSNEEHCLTQTKIINKLNDIGVDCDRRSVSKAINELIDFGYDIDRKPRFGYALFSRTFDKSEAEYLIHATFSSRSIYIKDAKKLSDKIESSFSVNDRKDFSYINKSGEISRTDNPQVFLNIELIGEAIQKNKKISFEYLGTGSDLVKRPKKNGKRYLVFPYYIFVNNGSFLF